MKKTILAAAVAALSFSACEQAPSPPPVARVVVRPPTALAKPLDAGQLTAIEKPADTLALQHDQKNVDHLARAQSLELDGDLTGALTEARKALFDFPADEDTLKVITRVAPKLRQHAIAAKAFGQLAELSPDDAVPLVRQARSLISAGDFTQSMMVGRAAVKLDPNNPEAWHALGRAQLSSGDLPSAIIAFEKTVEIAPTHGYALNNLGLAYLRANENAAARQVLERAVAVLPNVAYVHNNLGVALERTGEVDLAKAAYQAATDLSPKYVKARVNADRVAKVQLPPMEEDQLPTDAQGLPEQ